MSDDDKRRIARQARQDQIEAKARDLNAAVLQRIDLEVSPDVPCFYVGCERASARVLTVDVGFPSESILTACIEHVEAMVRYYTDPEGMSDACWEALRAQENTGYVWFGDR